MRKFYKIAIDGPAGAGKSTIAKLLAEKLGILYIDSGAMYRAVTFYLIEKGLINKSEKEIEKHLKLINISFGGEKSGQKVYLNKKDVTSNIRTSLVNKKVSEVSAIKSVREEMVKRQKKFALNSSVIMDGRDIGTTVFKDADLKIYLTASSYVRAKRRMKDLKKLREKVTIQDLIKQINDRDNYDSSRVVSPLLKAQDAIVLDTSYMPINEVLGKICYFLPLEKVVNN